MSLDPHYMRSRRAAEALDRLVVTGLILGFGLTDPATAAKLTNRATFSMETDAGTLRGTFYASDFLDGRFARGGYWSPAWVHFRFDDVERAKRSEAMRQGRLNPYSGKWNFMFSGVPDSQAVDVEYMADSIRRLNPRNFTVESA